MLLWARVSGADGFEIETQFFEDVTKSFSSINDVYVRGGEV